MEQKKINIFSNPDEIDALINSKLKQFPCKGGKQSSKNVTWSDEELSIIDSVIWDYISKQGLSREQTAQQIHGRWDIALSTARRYITDSIKRMASTYTEEDQEEQDVYVLGFDQPIDYFKGGTWLAIPQGAKNVSEAKEFISYVEKTIDDAFDETINRTFDIYSLEYLAFAGSYGIRTTSPRSPIPVPLRWVCEKPITSVSL